MKAPKDASRNPATGNDRTPTAALFAGLLITLAIVLAYSWYISVQISGLRTLQTDLLDRNRRASLQLLRIQNDANQLGLAMRDMLDADRRYPVVAWRAQLDRIRGDLDDAVRQEEDVAVTRLARDQRRYLAASISQFWDAVDRMFQLAEAGHDDQALEQIRVSLQGRQEAMSNAASRLLVQNHEIEEQTAEQVREIYRRVQTQAQRFLGVSLVAIAVTGLLLIRSNRRLFGHITALSQQRHDLTKMLIETRESAQREIARELHDELGQLLTAIGAILRRAEHHAAEGIILRPELREAAEVAQVALERVRSLSQSLHPSLLEELGLEGTIDWYLNTVSRQLGLPLDYQHAGDSSRVPGTTAIHVYRILQEAISNVARHSGASRASVRLHGGPDALTLEVEDHGKGFDPGTTRRGLGLVTIRERAALIGGTLEFLRPDPQGTLVRLVIPLPATELT